jgi:hypothetical protein
VLIAIGRKHRSEKYPHAIKGCRSGHRKERRAKTRLAAHVRVIDCEWKAADQYDDNRYKTFSELAQRVMEVCAVELRDARSTSGPPVDDTRIDKDEFNQAIEIIGNARKRRQHH